MKPYHVPALVVSLILSLVGAGPAISITTGIFLYFYCKKYYCEEERLYQQLIKEVKEARLTSPS